MYIHWIVVYDHGCEMVKGGNGEREETVKWEGVNII